MTLCYRDDPRGAGRRPGQQPVFVGRDSRPDYCSPSDVRSKRRATPCCLPCRVTDPTNCRFLPRRSQTRPTICSSLLVGTPVPTTNESFQTDSNEFYQLPNQPRFHVAPSPLFPIIHKPGLHRIAQHIPYCFLQLFSVENNMVERFVLPECA